MSVNYILPTAVAATDQLVPRYRVVPVDESLFQEREFQKAGTPFTIGNLDETDESIHVSLLGTPIYSTLEFPIQDALADFVPVGLATSGVALRLDMAIFIVNQSKNIIKTSIQGRNGTIKEYIGLGDYQIEIQGAIVSPFPNRYPKEELKQLVDILNVPNQIPIVSGLLKLLNITQVVIDDYKIRDFEGSRNVVPFSIMASSDSDDSIVLNNVETIW